MASSAPEPDSTASTDDRRIQAELTPRAREIVAAARELLEAEGPDVL
jgi:hypothetical protein